MSKNKRVNNKVVTEKKFFCGQCKHHYDEHEKDVNGVFFMARCPFRKYSVFMRQDRCEKFELLDN